MRWMLEKENYQGIDLLYFILYQKKWEKNGKSSIQREENSGKSGNSPQKQKIHNLLEEGGSYFFLQNIYPTVTRVMSPGKLRRRSY